MNREIKFRGKRKGGREWIIGSFVAMDSFAYICVEKVCYSDDHSPWCKLIEVDYETVGQFTGVSDDSEDDYNDSEICGGDILELTYNRSTFRCKVEREGPGFLLASNNFIDGYKWMSDLIVCDGDYFWIPGSKIIGNIHDNPDLLEVNPDEGGGTVDPRPLRQP